MTKHSNKCQFDGILVSLGFCDVPNWLVAMIHDNDLKQKVQSRLLPKEQLLWVGRPIQGVILRKIDFMLVPFSLYWTGFASFMTFFAPSPMSLVGAILLLIGLYVTIGRFFYDDHVRGQTLYAVTDERALILVNSSLKSMKLRTLNEVNFSTRGKQRGTLMFGSSTIYAAVANAKWLPGFGHYNIPRFEGIENAEAVHRLILQQQRNP